MPGPKKPFRVLCFGDSLTSGYYGMGTGCRPYSITFEEKLSSAFPDRDVKVVENGMPGDVVSFKAFNQRLEEELRRAAAPYDWVIILGGTNDLAYGVATETICDALDESYITALKGDRKVLALTIPETHGTKAALKAKRAEINDFIMRYDSPNFYAFDLHAAIPYAALSDERRRQYWDDGVHLTSDGYDWMGNHLGAALIKFMIQNVGATDRRSRRMLRYAQDELMFEEEDGNPNRIDEGYVIVRFKDLD
ncbi:SGNH hydrolase-type esterase domain-containing protein [Plectosphaerella plurivora]|uniref:SGNH hydrolase-type esterase domain-containing protein n=1 Tax=Plectosphaerella plurivora TaxID=936078 RepID=A0A9P8VI38_9PEZI|nr:SGNH hydrolase-type esterase domain-containing protein [Plectosphaerella plurivora]